MNFTIVCFVMVKVSKMRSSFGSITKRGHNVYRLQWFDRAGKRRSKTVHGTRAVAQKVLASIECGITHIGQRMTYTEYWQEYVTTTFGNLKPKTVSEYNRLWSKYLEPRIGSWQVSETSWRDIQSVIDSIEAPVTQRHVYALWRKILNLALRDELIRANPCAGGISFKPRVKREKVIIPAQELPAYLDSIRGIKYESLLLVLLGGGLRLSEACALAWSDVEAWQDYAVVQVSKALVTVEGAPVLQNTTKTAKSRREVVIGAPFAQRLLDLKNKATDTRLSDASPITVTHNYRAWCNGHDVTYTRPGDFRSVYATLCGEAGCPDSLVSMQLGHTDGTTKGEHYQQATRMGKALVASTLAAYLESVRNANCTKIAPKPPKTARKSKTGQGEI